MISRVRLVCFKRFADHSFDLTGGPVLLAGPNNSGKTTLLHAISAWNLALKQWLLERGESAGKKKRISLVLDEFTALPLREMNLLWLNRHTARKLPERKTPGPAPIYVEVEFSRGKRLRETLTIEFLYQSEKQVYVRPVKSPDSPDPVEDLPEFARTINVVHVPAFSGIGTQEPKHASGIQHKLVGEDVDNRAMPTGLRLERWGRYEIENYLIVPSLLKRWVTDPQQPLLSEAAIVDNELAANFPAGFDFRQDAATLRDLKGSDFIVALLNKTQKPLDKRDLYMLAQQMTPDEFHPAIHDMLDKIAAILPATPPAVEANLAPPDETGVDAQE